MFTKKKQLTVLDFVAVKSIEYYFFAKVNKLILKSILKIVAVIECSVIIPFSVFVEIMALSENVDGVLTSEQV